MAYLGNAPARSFISFERQVFTIVNSQTAYTLDHSVNNENDLRLVINNIVQEPGSGKAYTASGTTLTLSAALTNGTDEMYCVFLGRATATNAPGAGSVGATQLASDAVTAAKLNDDIISGQTALGATPADTDELLVSDAGTIKRVDYSYLKVANTPAFRAKLGSNQTVSDASSNKVAIDTEEYDTDGAFDTSTSRFTVPSNKAGKYFFGFQLWTFDANAGTSNFAQIFLTKNGVTQDPSTVRVYGAFSNHNLSFANTAVLDLAVGDYVEFWCYIDYTSSTFTLKADQTSFTGFKLIG